MVDNETGESRDGTGAGDHDVAYEWGHPREMLSTMQQARLLVMRGYVLDFRAGNRGGAADGDLPIFIQSESGLFVLRDVAES